MKVYYIYDKDDYKRPHCVCKQDWCGNVVKSTLNTFLSKKDAKNWCWEQNRRYISRAPYEVREEII